jgi:hypothetical protein
MKKEYKTENLEVNVNDIIYWEEGLTFEITDYSGKGPHFDLEKSKS